MNHLREYDLEVMPFSYFFANQGIGIALKTMECDMRKRLRGDAENARCENAGLENSFIHSRLVSDVAVSISDRHDMIGSVHVSMRKRGRG